MTPRRDFERGADSFERRAGLPPPIAARVAAAVIELANAQRDSIILEIGAGSGIVGRHIADLGVRHIGLDASFAMLQAPEIEQNDASRPVSSTMLMSDCDAGWPVADNSILCVFASRVLHLLNPVHVQNEWNRVRKASSAFLVGRTSRDESGYRELLRTRLHELLEARGIPSVDGRRKTREFLEGTAGPNVTPITPGHVARWSRSGTPADLIRSWSDRDELGGVSVPAEIREDVIERLTQWAVRRFGDIFKPLESVEGYVIEGARWNDESREV